MAKKKLSEMNEQERAEYEIHRKKVLAAWILVICIFVGAAYLKFFILGD